MRTAGGALYLAAAEATTYAHTNHVEAWPEKTKSLRERSYGILPRLWLALVIRKAACCYTTYGAATR